MWLGGPSPFIDPKAYVVDDTGFPKDGPHSPGVARMYSGALGKVGNCQIGVSVQAVTDWASAAIDWRLFLPKSWDDTVVGDDVDAAGLADIRRRRAQSRIPDGVGHREKWRQALDMLDEILAHEQAGGWALARRPVVADAGYGDVTEFRLGLTERGLTYALAVQGTTSAYPADTAPTAPPYSGRGRPPVPRYRADPTNLAALRSPPAAGHCAGSPGATARGRMHATRPRR